MSRYVPATGFDVELERQPDMQRHLADTARTVAVEVVGAAPRKRGDYRRSVRARENRVETLDPFWHLIEYGSRNNPIYAPLRRGARNAGLRLVLTPA